jgi:hypothetical protein
MKLYFSDPTSRPAININRLNRYTYNIREIILSTPSPIDALIVLGDGSPEDEIVGILVHHQKADKTVGVIKPDKHAVDSFSTAKFYFEQLKAECLIFMIDQDDAVLDELFDTIGRVISRQGIAVASSQPLAETDRAKIYECTLAGKEFRIIAVVSGVADFEAPVHEIEDHLLKLAGINGAGDAKESWSQVPKERKEAILTSLKDRQRVKEAFPQHFAAFSQI